MKNATAKNSCSFLMKRIHSDSGQTTKVDPYYIETFDILKDGRETLQRISLQLRKKDLQGGIYFVIDKDAELTREAWDRFLKKLDVVIKSNVSNSFLVHTKLIEVQEFCCGKRIMACCAFIKIEFSKITERIEEQPRKAKKNKEKEQIKRSNCRDFTAHVITSPEVVCTDNLTSIHPFQINIEVAQYESVAVEFKRVHKATDVLDDNGIKESTILKCVSAMQNSYSRTGDILLGICDGGFVHGVVITEDNKAKIEKINRKNEIGYTIIIHPVLDDSRIQIDGLAVLRIHIKESKSETLLRHTDGSVYTRLNASVWNVSKEKNFKKEWKYVKGKLLKLKDN